MLVHTVYHRACRTQRLASPLFIFSYSLITKTIFRKMKSFQVDASGFYGRFGGAYVPEILYKTVEDLKNAYLPIIESKEFQDEYRQLLRDYVGRPSPLYFAAIWLPTLFETRGPQPYRCPQDQQCHRADLDSQAYGQDTHCGRNRCRPAWCGYCHCLCADEYAMSSLYGCP